MRATDSQKSSLTQKDLLKGEYLGCPAYNVISDHPTWEYLTTSRPA